MRSVVKFGISIVVLIVPDAVRTPPINDDEHSVMIRQSGSQDHRLDRPMDHRKHDFLLNFGSRSFSFKAFNRDCTHDLHAHGAMLPSLLVPVLTLVFPLGLATELCQNDPHSSHCVPVGPHERCPPRFIVRVFFVIRMRLAA
jgi:hypothetical protein